MFYFIRIIFIFLIILLNIPLKVCEAQRYRSPESVPDLSQIIINGDSVISFQETKNDSGINSRQLMLDYRSNNVKFRMAPPGEKQIIALKRQGV